MKMFIHNTNYYTYLGTHYHKSFPLIWAMKIKQGQVLIVKIVYAMPQKKFLG